MSGLGGMDEERRGAGRCERRRELARDVSRFSDTGDDHASAAIENQLYRADKRFRQSLRQSRDRARFGIEYFTGERKRAFCIDNAIDGGLHGSGLHRAKVYAPCYRIAAIPQ